jgi:uncharacterized MAPEG superfamily protein
MISATALTLTAFIAWALLLLVLMAIMRSQLVLRGKVPANGFTPDNAGLSPFMQRLARAHANCVESLPVFGGLLLLAIVTEKTAITDPLAYMFLASRIIQSLVHLVSTSPIAVMVRFAAFAAQIIIGLYWVFLLLSLQFSTGVA